VSSLTPTTALKTAPLVRAAIGQVEASPASISSRSEDRGHWAHTRRGAARPELPPQQTILPPDRSAGGERGQRQARPQDERAFWPTSAFFAQHLSQETLPDDTPTVGHAAGAAKYPSLGFETEIFLPGEAISASTGPARRLDITV
jgi:hypothetical protein